MNILDKYDYIVNDKTGIVKKVYKKNNPVVREFIHYTGIITNPRFLISKDDKNKRYTLPCGGTSFDDSTALVKCLGECLERYASQNVNYKNFINGSFNELTEKGYRCIHVKEFSFFSDEQYLQQNFPFKRVTGDTILYWIKCKDLYSYNDVLIPAELIFLNHVEKFCINYNISTGQACGETLEDAILTSIYEVIERDSFIMTWKKKISFPHINLKTIDDADINKVLKEFHDSSMDIYLVKSEMEYGIPTIIGVIFNRNLNYENILIDSSSKPTYKEAIMSVLESLANLVMININSYNKEDRGTNSNSINSLEDRIKIFMNTDVWNEAEFLNEGDCVNYTDLVIEDEKNINKSRKQLTEEIVSKLNEFGIKSYYCDITTRDIEQLGFKVAKVVSPDLLSLDISSNYMYLGGRRLIEANKLFNDYKHIDNINFFPHPFL